MSTRARQDAAAYTLRSAQECAKRASSSTSPGLDLSGLVHNRARHADMTSLAMLAWWLLSTEQDVSSWTLRVPGVGTAPYLPLVRSGLVTAALLRGVKLAGPADERLGPSALTLGQPAGQARLPGADWVVTDGLAGDGRLRIVPDLADPRRAPRLDSQVRFNFPWLTKLGLASPAIGNADYQRFMADADLVLRELIDNVHRWSRASEAFAVVSTTRGSSTAGNWNRLHIVIADAGIGIPSALRADVQALEAVHSASGDSAALHSVSDGELVERLMRHSFGDRRLINHNGHGLNVAQVRSGHWVGALDIVTVDGEGRPLRRGAQGVNPARYDANDELDLPHARGTLIHLLLQAASEHHRGAAAEYEQLRIDQPAGSGTFSSAFTPSAGA